MKEGTIIDNDTIKADSTQANQSDGSYFAPPSYAKHLADIPPSSHKCYECYTGCCGSFLGWIGTACCCMCHPYVKVPQGYAGIQKRFGKAYRVVDPGVYFVNSMCEVMDTVDIKVQIKDMPRQLVTTKDNVVIDIDSVVYWKIVDPFVAKFHVVDIRRALLNRTVAILRAIVGSHTLQEVIENREEIAKSIKDSIDPLAASWGVEVEATLINDLRIAADLRECLSSVVKAQRIGLGKVITARSHRDAAKLYREASELLNTPAAIHMKRLDTMIAMAKTRNSRIIFTPDELNDLNN